VGDLEYNRTITVDGKDWKASDWAKTQLGPLCRRKTTVDVKDQWYYSKSICIAGVTHTVQFDFHRPRMILLASMRCDICAQR
jgi:hypothetical protein